MAHPSEPSLLVLHGLRLKGVADTDALAPAVGLQPADVAKQLDGFAATGLVQRREGRLAGWTLTPSGRGEHRRRLEDELDASGCRPVVEDAYRRFAALNPDLLEVCTAWQMRDVEGQPVVNDHADAGYDQQVVERLVALHDRVRPVCADLRGCFERFERYSGRLRSALERVVAGEQEWFARPVIDSYHTVWFELHEDLLSTLGLERSAEAEAPVSGVG